MITYAQNPSLGLTTVITVRGDKEYRRNCRCIQTKYYLMERDCFLVKGKWTRVDSGNIFLDSELNVWVHRNDASHLINGIVGFEAGKPVVGWFSANHYNNANIRIKNVAVQKAINTEILETNGCFEDPATNIWYRASDMTSSDIKSRKVIRNERDHTQNGYNIEDNAAEAQRKSDLYEKYPIHVTKKAKEMSKYLGDLTFGAEIEVSHGNLPLHIMNRHNVLICRDGSIDGGPEFVTNPLSGARGLQNLVNLCDEAKKRTKLSIACAFHVHFGNVRRDKLFIAAFYILSRKVQDELFTMFPYYKTDYRSIKKKNYNQKLDKLGIHPLVKDEKEEYEAYLVDVHARIFDFLAEGKMTLDQVNKKTRAHPIRSKWERKNRYFWMNIMNMFFTHRHTVEFRLHGPTTNSHKIINWMFICIAMIKYAEKYAMEIIRGKNPTISLRSILDIFSEQFPKDRKASFLGDYLYAYFKSRQEIFKKDFDRGDRVSMWDIEQDGDFKFEYEGVKGLI